MMQNSPSLATILDTRTPLKSGKFPIKLRITFTIYSEGKKKWVPKYYGTSIEASKEEFESIQSNPRAPELRRAKAKLVAIEAKAQGVLKINPNPSITFFEQMFMETGNLETISGMFDRYIKYLTTQGRVSSTDLYEAAKNTFISYGGSNITFAEITPEWLKEYEKDMLKKGKSVNTIGIYLRNLRSIYNQAIELRMISRENYPFTKSKYKIPTSTGRKISLSKANKEALMTYVTLNENRQKALDFWKLSYYCYGMNFTDIAMLRRSNIKGESITVIRQKTINTERNKRELEIFMRDEIKSIVSKYAVKSLNPDAYLFDILKPDLSAVQQKNRIKDFIKRTNKYLKEISKDIGLGINLTTYTARHTFATTLRDAGVATSMIQKLMDHQSQNTTEIYFGSIDMNDKIKISGLY